MFIQALFTRAKMWKKPRYPSTEGWVKKLWYVYTMEYDSAIKITFNNVICNNMDGPRDRYTE